MARKLEPMGDRIVIKAVEREERTKGGIYLPDTAKERPQEGEVIAVGPGRVTDDGKRVPLDVKAGDTVVYSKFAGTEITEDEVDYLILTERDILARLA
jgi:chaperonin GroES